MKEDAFRYWLSNDRGHSSRTVGSRISNCRTVERYEGDLDQQFDGDQLRALLDRLTYSTADSRRNLPAPHQIPINGNVYNGTATLRSAVSLYKQFRENPNEGPPANRSRFAASSRVIQSQESRTTQTETGSRQPALARLDSGATLTVSATQLGDWRRKLVSLLVVLEKTSESSERLGVSARIGRLQRAGLIPGEIGAMMRTITEMRNATEYEAKTLSAAEGSAVNAAWTALQEWAHGRGINSLA